MPFFVAKPLEEGRPPRSAERIRAVLDAVHENNPDRGEAGPLAAGLSPDSVDAVLMNPPFNDPARHRVSPDRARETAHVATATTLENWIHAARRVLKPKGMLTLIWRADGIAEVLAALDRGFGSLQMLPVHVDVTAPANRILIRATKGGRAPTQIQAALMLNDESGVPNKEVQEILSGNGILPLAIP